MKKSESIKNISKALLDFAKEVDKIEKTAKNPFFKSDYAPLPEILKAIKNPLQKSGLVISQMPSINNCLNTIIVHVDSGEYFEDSFEMMPIKADPQAQGSAITYARRYVIGAMLNLNIDNDDDGNKATSNTKNTTSDKKWINPDTVAWVNAIKKLKTGDIVFDDVKKAYKISKENEEKLINEMS